MASVTVKLPIELDKKLRAAARRRGEGLSELVRRALEREIATDGPDFVSAAGRYKGMFRGPSDLSTREG